MASFAIMRDEQLHAANGQCYVSLALKDMECSSCEQLCGRVVMLYLEVGRSTVLAGAVAFVVSARE
jgi:hypothetical protein